MKNLIQNILFPIICLTIACSTNDSVSTDRTNENNNGMANPAACYCEQLGYKYIIKDSTGAKSYCLLPNEIKASGFLFLKGEIYQEYSYFVKFGYQSVIDSITNQYGRKIPRYYCVKFDSLNNIIEKITLHELMNRHGDTLCNGKLFFENKQ